MVGYLNKIENPIPISKIYVHLCTAGSLGNEVQAIKYIKFLIVLCEE